MYSTPSASGSAPSSWVRNLSVTSIAILIWVILCTLGFNPANEPIDGIAVIWPGAILHAVGAILLGGWGIVATVLAAVIVDIIKVGTPHVVLGFIIPDFIQAFIPAWYYRRRIAQHGWGRDTFAFTPFLIYAVLLPNIAGAFIGTLIFHMGSAPVTSLWFPFVRWLVANIPVALLLGWPLLKCLGPVMADEGLTVKGWWR